MGQYRRPKGTTVDIRNVLLLVQQNPSLLPAAPLGVTAQMIDFRREDAVHDCLVCGERAGAAFVADTSEGPRWLDLCMSHSDEVRRAD